MDDKNVQYDILNTREAAEYLGVRPQTLRNWRCRGGGPRYVRRGIGLRSHAAYTKAELDAWLEARTFANTTAETVAA